MPLILEACALTKTYRSQEEENRVLNGVDIAIEQGEFLAIMGPSGSGKSSLLFALSTIDGIDSGKIFFENRDLATLSDDALSDIRLQAFGFVFQQPTMLKNLSLLDNILLPAWEEKGTDKTELLARAKDLISLAGLAGLEDREVTQVSGGQLQRAGICRALLHQPAILFADEPTGALNSKTSQEIMKLFSRIHQQGTTIVLVTHDAKVAAVADRVLFMTDGRIQSEVRQDPKDMENNLSHLREEMQVLGI